MITVPTLGRSTRRASQGGEDHSAGFTCLTSYMKYTPSVRRAPASSVANTKIQSTPGIPDFMDWNQITALPLFWQPFHSLTFTIAAVILVPGIGLFGVGAQQPRPRGALGLYHLAWQVDTIDELAQAR